MQNKTRNSQPAIKASLQRLEKKLDSLISAQNRIEAKLDKILEMINFNEPAEVSTKTSSGKRVIH